jgi:hypothetical protein
VAPGQIPAKPSHGGNGARTDGPFHLEPAAEPHVLPSPKSAAAVLHWRVPSDVDSCLRPAASGHSSLADTAAERLAAAHDQPWH